MFQWVGNDVGKKILATLKYFLYNKGIMKGINMSQKIKSGQSKNQHQSKNKGPWLYGMHPVTAALQNPNRKIKEIQGVKNALDMLKIPAHIPVKIVAREQIDALVGQSAVHQGVVAKCEPLPIVAVEDVVRDVKNDDKALFVILDQVFDPHNVGAILRSAAAFGVRAVIVPDANAPEESGTLAKSASGALEVMPLIRVSNLVRTMEYLKKQGFWCVGMDGYAEKSIGEDRLPAKCVIVMGSEGDGMRRLTAENCDYTVKLPIARTVESLNVSNACAIALYEWQRIWQK